MKQFSRRNHYLPVYYLRGFTNADGLFFIYDKVADRILPKPMTPEAMFFENNLNVMSVQPGTNTDFIEHLYTEVENVTKQSLDNLRNSQNTDALSYLDKLHLWLFLLFLHWRLPRNSPHAQKLSQTLFSKDGELSYLKLERKDGSDADEEKKNKLRSLPGIDKIAKLVAPFAPFLTNQRDVGLTSWRFHYAGDYRNWFMVGDHPILTMGINDHDPVKCLSEFIFPVSGAVLLTNTVPPPERTLSPEFVIQLCTTMVSQCKRFVASPDRGFLEAIIGDYKEYLQHRDEKSIVLDTFRILHVGK